MGRICNKCRKRKGSRRKKRKNDEGREEQDNGRLGGGGGSDSTTLWPPRGFDSNPGSLQHAPWTLERYVHSAQLQIHPSHIHSLASPI
jgi:hypothetical protein